MAKPVVLTPEAEVDSDQAYFWYESRRIGLGREFLTAVDACIQSIHRNPKLYQVLYKGYRRAVIRRFPYAILYEETEAEIVVYAVFDCRQAPAKWRERLQ